MKALNRHPTCKVYTHVLRDAADWAEPPFDGAQYVVLLALTEGRPDDAVLGQTAKNLIETGCRCVNIWGEDCWRIWEVVNQQARTHDQESEHRSSDFVLIKGLEEAPAREVAEQFLLSSDFDEQVFANFLILFCGRDAQSEEELTKALREELSDGEEFYRSLSPELQRKYNEIHQRGSQL